MRVLLVHPEDELEARPWTSSGWDRVIDLGRSGLQTYARAEEIFGCAVDALDDLRENFSEIYRVRGLLENGYGRLCDKFGLDWWELTAIFLHHQMESAILLHDLSKTLGPLDEVHISRPGFHAEALRVQLGPRLHVFPRQEDRSKSRVEHYFRLARKFPVRELLGIFWDKHDSGYQIRGLVSRPRKPQEAPVVLLPTAYVNASRTGIAYASSLPDERFLLVATRRSGWIERPPSNVSQAWLRCYASLRAAAREIEYVDLTRRWNSLRLELDEIPEFRVLMRLGCFESFPVRLAKGLEVRDAWRNVLDTEPVQAVICADDSNPYTHIPLLLAKERGLRTISCHHGALDGRLMFKRSHADVMLVKGEMEEDYAVRLCGMAPEKVEVGAPMLPANLKPRSGPGSRGPIFFFSESYEVAGGRAKDFYQDLLPALADLALSEQRELIVKLHPAENVFDRNRVISRLLSVEQKKKTRVVAGPLPEEIFDSAWFGITVLSTVAVECALRGIPCFLCQWLESWPYGYVDQFTRFGVGIRLSGPEQIREIPAMLRQGKPNTATSANLWGPITQDRLRVLLGIERSGTQGTLPSTANTVGKL